MGNICSDICLVCLTIIMSMAAIGSVAALIYALIYLFKETFGGK